MSKSNYLENEALDHIIGGSAYTAPATVYISLHTATSLETGANEVTGNAYARVAVTNNLTQWPAASGGSKSNASIITWPTPTPSGWGTVTHFGIWDALSSGNLLYAGALSASKVINNGDTVEADPSSIVVTED